MIRIPLTFVALLAGCALAGCGSSAKPLAAAPGTTAAGTAKLGRGRIDDPRDSHLSCIRAAGIQVVKVGQADLRIGSAPGDATIHFEPTAGAAQQAQISGSIQGAEVIGSALLYPHRASEADLGPVEQCLSVGVQG
jgi:hypothetical protein